MKFNEQYTVENHIIKFISGVNLSERTSDQNNENDLGYEYVSPEEFSKLREFESEYVIVPLLLEAVKKINNISEEEAATVVREVRKIDTNEGFLDLYRNGVNIKDLKTGKKRDYIVIDYNNIENNRFVVTNQFYFEGELENIRPDIMIFLNGLPIVDIEAKSPTASTSVDFEKAIGQLKRYEKNSR
ncbi:MAG: type I restriction endonuclease, partial [Bacilli bacterium]